MSAAAQRWAIQCSQARGLDYTVLLILAWHADGDDIAHPGARLLAREARCSVGTAVNALRRLVARGDLDVAVPGHGRAATRYRVHTLSTGPASDHSGVNANGAASDHSGVNASADRCDHSDPRSVQSDPRSARPRGERVVTVDNGTRARAGARTREGTAAAGGGEQRPGPANPTTTATEVAARLDAVEVARPEVAAAALAAMRGPHPRLVVEQ